MQVELHVLGPLRLVVGGRMVELGPPRRRSVLAALAVEAGRTVALDALIDAVWDGDPPANASVSVHAYVSRLRSSMRAFDRDGRELSSCVVTQAPGYRLDLPSGAVDAHRFATGVAAARAARSAGDLDEASRSVREALALWREEAYHDIGPDFARREADRLRDTRIAAGELALQVDLERGRHEDVLAEVGLWTALAPWREGLQAAQLLALYRSGRQADALSRFGRFRRRLADDLGVDPGPALRRLHEQILRQDAELDLPVLPTPGRPAGRRGGSPAAGDGPVGGAAAGSAATAAIATGPRLVGREAELARLDGLLADRTALGRLVAVAVVGEPGIGKTRLLEEAAAHATGRGDLVVWGRCWEHEGAPRLWPWIQALEALVDQVPAAAVEQALGGRAVGVTALLPRLSALHHEAAPAPTETNRVQLYDAVLDFVAGAARDRRLLMVLDDVQWADAASRELAEYAVTHRGEVEVGLLVGVRSPADDPSSVATDLLTSWARSGRTERIDLGGWSATAAAQYVVERTGDVLDPATAEALVDRTAGNPFFVAELVRLLVTDISPQERGRALREALPESIRDVIARRTARLPETDQTVLRTAAVVGRAFDLDLLEAVAGRAADEVDEAVDRATELGILSSEAGDASRHRFVHALSQQTLLDTTGPARRRRIHERVAHALQERLDRRSRPPGAAETEQLAYHLARSGSAQGCARAVDLCLQVADLVLTEGNFPETESLLLRALDLTARLDPDAAGPKEMTARVRLWSLYTLTSGPGTPEALGQHERAVTLIERFGGVREVMAGHQAAHSRLTWTADLDAMERLVTEMSAAAEAADDDLMRAAADIVRAEVLISRNRPGAALAVLDVVDGRAAALRVTPPGVFPIEPRVQAQVWRCFAHSLAGDDGAARAVSDRAEQELDGAPQATAAYGRILFAMRAAMVGDVDRSLRLAERAWALTSQHGLVEAGSFLAPLLAWGRERRTPGSALDQAVAAVEGTATMPTMGHRTGLRALLADVLIRAGRYQEASASITAARAEAARTGEELFLPLLDELDRAASSTRPR